MLSSVKVALVAGVLVWSCVPGAQGAYPSAAPAVGSSVRAQGAESLFGHPTFLPLRSPARVSCVNRNCDRGGGRYYHGDWAIDLLGERGDPIYAAGNGIAHVGCSATGCNDDKQESRGKWIWIDHGGGEQTNYYHFDSIAVSDGQAVTPDTLLGRMGSTGDGRQTDYLHFERRVTDLTSKRVYPGTLWACANGRPVGYPQALGYRNWDDIPKLQAWVSSEGTGCIPRPARAGAPTIAGVQAQAARRNATVSWQPPTLNPAVALAYRVSVSLWHPSTSEWDDPVFFTTAATTSWQVPDLQYRRTYRVRVATIDAGGYSPWSSAADFVVANPPARPTITKLTPARRSLRTVWKIPPNGGNKITRYQATLLYGTTSVRSAKLPPRVREVTWSGLRRRTPYRVTVVAVNRAGTSAPAIRAVRTR